MSTDIPRSSGNTFLIFSAIPVGSSTGPGVTRLAPSLESITGIASITGGLNNSALEITPNGAKTGFDVLCKARDTAGTYSFEATVTTNGDAEHDAATCVFTFQVVLLGADAVHDVIIREYRVDDVVDEELSLSPVCPIHDYRVQGALRTMDDNAYPSGLTLWVQTIDDVDHPRLTGTAARPGIYVASLDVTTWNDDALHGSGTGFASGTNMAVPVIVCIYEHPYQVGQLLIVIKKKVDEDPDLINVIRVNDTDKALYPNIRKKYEKSGEAWTRTVADEYTTEEYKIELADGTWTLSGRVYTTGETAPAYTAIATADQVPGCVTPPSAGWSNDAVIGGFPFRHIYSADKTVDYGFFDWKGEDEAGHVIAQQATYWIRQFPGWSRPAEWQHMEEYIYKWDDETGDYAMFTKAGVLVLAATALSYTVISGVAVPYSPVVAETYATATGSVAVRDPAAVVTTSGGQKVAVNLGKPLVPGELALKIGNKAGGIWPFYPAHRKWVPYNGTTGDVVKQATVTLGTETGSYIEEEAYSSSSETSGNEPVWVTRIWHKNFKQGYSTAWSFSGELPAGRRDGTVPQWFLANHTGSIGATYYYEGSSRQDGYAKYLGFDTRYYTLTEYSNLSQEVTPSGNPATIMFWLTCAPDEHGEHSVFCASKAYGGGGTCDYVDRVVVTEVVDDEVISVTPTDTPGSIGISPNFMSFIPSFITGSSLSITPQFIRKEVGTLTCRCINEVFISDFSGDEDVLSTEIVVGFEATVVKTVHYVKIGEVYIDLGTTVKCTETTRTAGIYPGWIRPPGTTVITESTDLSYYLEKKQKYKDRVAAYDISQVISAYPVDKFKNTMYELKDSGSYSQEDWN